MISSKHKMWIAVLTLTSFILLSSTLAFANKCLLPPVQEKLTQMKEQQVRVSREIEQAETQRHAAILKAENERAGLNGNMKGMGRRYRAFMEQAAEAEERIVTLETAMVGIEANILKLSKESKAESDTEALE